MADLASGGIVRGENLPPWAEADSGSCEYLISRNATINARNVAILAEAQRRLDESGGQ